MNIKSKDTDLAKSLCDGEFRESASTESRAEQIGESLVRGVSTHAKGHEEVAVPAPRTPAVAADRCESFGESIVAVGQIVAVPPRDSRAWRLLPDIRAGASDHERAVDSCARALALDPGNICARFNLGVSQQALGRVEEAEAAYRSVLARDNLHLGAWVNLGACLKAQGRLSEAIAVWCKAEKLFPSSTELRYNLACALLLMGRWTEGWPGYEERWRVLGRRLPVPDGHSIRWCGEKITGGTLLVHHEQGLGDTIQFVRFLRYALTAFRDVIFVCPRRLQRLLSQGLVLGASQVDRDRLRVAPEGEVLPKADAWIPLLSSRFTAAEPSRFRPDGPLSDGRGRPRCAVEGPAR